MRTIKITPTIAPNVFTALMAACFSSGALAATEFEFGDGWTGTWLSTISVGTSVRARNADSELYGKGNGALVGLPNGTGNNTIDEGNLNYRRGDAFSTPFKLLSEVSFRKDSFGGLIRAKAWYDETLKNDSVYFGNQANGYNGYNRTSDSLTKRKPLSDKGFDPLLKYSGVALLDAYIYDTFNGLGDKPVQVRAGRHVLNWGESVFIQGVNQINPIDVPAARRPGAELKEVFMPVWMLSGSQSLGDLGALEAFYQLKWEPTPIEAGCGNYWSVAQGNISKRPGACFNASALSSLTDSTPKALADGTYIPTLDGKNAKNSGQFGLAYRFNSDALDTEFGLYAMNIHARTPVFSLKYGSFPGTVSSAAAFWEYPENVKVYGVSAATNLFGWSVSGEYSLTRDVRAQLDGNDMFFGSFGLGPLATRASANGAGTSNGTLHGGVKANKNQLQINALQAGNGFMGADQWLVVGEVGVQWNDLPMGGDLRFNRPFIFGPGPHAEYGGNTCAAGFSHNEAGCSKDKGYVTKSAWGYRLLGQLTFNNVYGTGVATSPRVFWSHDVKGYAIDSQFVEDRQTLGLGVKFDYQKKYTLDLSYNAFNRNASFDSLRDRDYMSATLSANF
ncbi:DUF1302 domain-containing protein [Pseudomonas fluorescens]|uniref:DUF1302 domain-containing protein n=1 Tax=Pseudomonas fluorescens TaxID=294 RepID=A0A5E7UZB3_PSEFL|nr:DUF1302 domain-containing protein [Pseudomonas fluorescens]VVQ15710.1 hypothetical protein PS928_04296 [Pseudomonas fluorescens]